MAGFALLSLSCLRVDPNHCANQGGDATCVELEAGQFCSACARTNFGCVDERPDDACWFESEGVGSSSTGTTSVEPSSGSDESSSSGPPPACEREGELDPACPEGNPYCIDGVCAGCDAGNDDFCGDVDTATPVCHEQWGRCVECTSGDASACTGASRWCGLDYTCGGCTEHTQCPDSACNLATGECMDDDPVVHVDGAACPGPGTGSAGDPFCAIADGLEQIPMGGQGTILLHGAGQIYEDGITLTSDGPRTVAVIGVQNPAIVAEANSWAVDVGSGMKLFVANLLLSSSTGSGVRCNGSNARLWIDDSGVRTNVDGIIVRLGKLQLRRSLVVDNEGSGIVLSERADLVAVSSVIANNGTLDGAGVGINADDATFDLRYTTVVANDSSVGGNNIYCSAGGGGPIRNSVVLSQDLESMDCPWAEAYRSVLDVNGIMGSDNTQVEAWDDLWWKALPMSDFHVRDPKTSPLRDLARWELGDPALDLDGVRREAYPGAVGFAGADEP